MALYPFNNPADLGQDSSGTGNNLVADTGTPAYSSQGLYGGSLYLNGSSTMDLPGAAFPTGVPTGDSPYTVAAWVKAAPGTSLTGGWLGYGNNADSQGNNFRLGNGSVGGDNDVWEYWYNNDFGATLPGNETFYDGFHSVVATWDGTNEDIYLDGVLAATCANLQAPDIGTSLFVVGNTTNDADFTGWVDDLDDHRPGAEARPKFRL